MDLSSHEGDIPIPTPIPTPIPIKYVVDPTPNSPNTTGTGIVENHDSITCYRNAPPSSGGGGGDGGGNEINKKGVCLVKYRECLKNHAASIGGNATDGCGEFMPSGEEGTMEALKCSACNCHRNFHRREVEGESSSFELLYQNRHQHQHGGGFKGRKILGKKGVLISGSNTDPFMYRNSGHNSLIPMPSPHHMIMPLGAMQTSDQSDEMEGVGGGFSRPMKKRFRTKFTQDQKDKMLSFAESSGWRLQKQEESVVQQFCQEIGVRRRVLKVWMHNNKHNLQTKKDVSTINNQLS
ncbi:Zinc finger-homeodomain protein 1 [Zostera marina]|uniref:Zinc finger-homeodomain protein 1 n=1 Tax=Zostera marina TaxID=29655 RepID=A0A0K9Q4L7_ZOSMR|nr:Zinc finger-homeodomain protein 1 [Zostera marina]